MEYTPEGFGKALGRLSRSVEQGQKKAITDRAKITKDGILLTAKAVHGIGGVKPGWVRYTIEGSGASVYAKVRLSGGFAMLTERGSYKHGGGWQIVPKAQKRATRRARTRILGRGVAGPVASSDIGGAGGVLGGEGLEHPVARVEHPALHARPFFKAGVEASRHKSLAAYDKAINQSMRRALG